MLVVGSYALSFHGLDLGRPINDLDIIATSDEYEGFLTSNAERIILATRTKSGFAVHMLGENPIDFEIVKSGSTGARLIDILSGSDLIKSDGVYDYAAPDVIYALKMSHRFLRNSPHFRKTMDDIHKLRAAGCTIPAVLSEWVKERSKATYYYTHPSLAQTKGNFFKDDNINYIYDHDTIHLSVQTFDRPAFEYIKKNTAEVYCSKQKFMEADEAIRLATVLEESYVLALERHQIPNDFVPDRRKSFDIALMKVCTSISSGWWREYSYENYHAVAALYDQSYVDRFKDGLVNGVIKPFVAVHE